MSKRTTGSLPSGAVSSDAELTDLIRSGSPVAAAEALEELYRRHRAPVLAYAYSCTRDSHTAEDLTSEAFARALRALRGGSGPSGAWRPYLLTTVRRTAAAWSVTARRTQLAPDFETWVSESAADSGEEWVMRREEANLALRAFHSLPQRWQTALWHSAVEGESPDRIAPLLGLSPSAAASLTARAREGLREAYLVEHSMDLAASDECRHYTGLLAAAVRRSGRAERAHRGLERHLADCSRCRRAHTELRDLNRSLSMVLPAGVLMWMGTSHGLKSASTVGTAASGGTGVGLPQAVSGLSTAAKVGSIGVVLLAVSIGGYALYPKGGGTAAPSPSAVATVSVTPTPTGRWPDSPSPASPSPRPPSKSPRPIAPPPTWLPAASDRTRLPIADTGRCMDISRGEGAEPYEAPCSSSRTQQWELLVDRANQEVRIRNYATGMCLTHTDTQEDGAPVRQEAACRSSAITARWTFFTRSDGEIVFAEKGNNLYYLGLNDWHTAEQGAPHSPVIGTTANYYNTPSLRFRYTGHAFGN